MPTINANTVAIFIDTTGGSVSDPTLGVTAPSAFQPVLYSTSATVSLSNATYEATSITNSSGAVTTRDFAVGTQSASLQVEGVLSFDTETGQLDLDALFDAFLAKNAVTAVWASTDVNIDAYGGQGFITSFELNSGVDDFGTFSCGIELSGDLQKT